MVKYFCGVDGGGTSCRARIVDEQGHFLGEAKTGSANILLGVELAMASIEDAISQAAHQAGISDLSEISVGLALAGAEQKSAWLDFMSLPQPYGHFTLNTDGYGACIGAFSGENGAIVIAGTGSVGIYLENGNQHVVGGREFPISDQGGGAVMGLRLIQQTLLAHDDLRATSSLSEYVLTHFDHDLDAIVSWSKTAKPRDYGQFSPKIFELAMQRDELAMELLQGSADDVERLILGLNRKGAKQIALMGSIGERIVSWLSPAAQALLVQPKADAMAGAILMASGDHNLYPFPR
ncbi:N-acetylglucosamine kinase [Enterovibrio norvegicus FF-33]|uniref:BadF/BadG/BcrA/BcrD ATPase family protein n=1 Tax=Enterovibrio norvegicus TaxID=188144 RepID=UPI00030DE4F7|nr:BadF/BadG/BcrA/BcrD ATPase family protein [Enterovibrio norvegicus]OEE69664.1 N-acetylglucosamine kinase [Enterovibrio norvegicus FF-33]OEE81690.1 N-acetylglucosamine kinase [Enterovibrio norvegicus FF-162]